jgi:transposase
VRTVIVAHIQWLESRLAELDADLARAIRESPLWREKDDLLQSAPGVGPVLARTLVANLPELGTNRDRRYLLKSFFDLSLCNTRITRPVFSHLPDEPLSLQ